MQKKQNISELSRSYKRIAYLTGIALVLITLGSQYFQYKRNQYLILTDLKNRLDEHTSNVNLRARTAQGYVNGLKIAAENALYYIKQFKISSPFFSHLKDSPTKQTYFLDIRSLPTIKPMVGNLTGFGSIESLPENIKRELNMALLLNTFFEVALKSNRGSVWVYYTSKNHFQNLYPWLPTNPNLPCRSLEKELSYIGALPEKNSNRLNFWTQAYLDNSTNNPSYQKGIVLTNSSPVYDGDEFLGSVSLDLSLIELNRVMNRFSPSYGSLFLINKDHQVLATKDASPLKAIDSSIPVLDQYLSIKTIEKIDQEINDPSGWFFHQGSSIIYVNDLHEAPWYIVYIGSKSELFMQSFLETLEDIFIIIVILTFVVGMGYLIVIRDFISPTQKLINHIERENQGLKSVPHSLPSWWKPWFDIVSRIFTENRALLADLENRVKIRTKQLLYKNNQLEKTLMNLKKAQDQIIVQEKLASLGSLTAGIAHEIKNPLNFIINFSDLSLEYLHELREKVSNENELFTIIEQNIMKTREHAERADSIVKGMLAHARGSTGEITTFNLNKLLDESIELAYVGFQGKEHYFTAIISKQFDQTLGNIQGSKQDLARVFLNIVNNACFSMHEKKEKLGDTYKAELTVKTVSKGSLIEITFEDNGLGMSQSVLKKIFNPFFTTKDSGMGTGLGLSISYDIIAHQHQGTINVESEVGTYSRFIIDLPKEK